VVVGRVQQSSARWQGSRIITEVQVKVATPILGQSQAGSTLTLQVPGGRVGDLAQVIQGTPRFEQGQDVLLFLERHPRSGALRPVGLSQGRFSVYQGQDSKLWVSQQLEGLSLAEPAGEDAKGRTVARMAEHADQGVAPMPLDELVRGVAQTAVRLEVPVRAEIKQALGADLKGSFDFGAALKGLDIKNSPRLQQPGPTPKTF
jgi:hypothetical protein